LNPAHAVIGATALAVASAGLGGWAGWDWRDASAQRERVAAVEEYQREEAALRGRMEQSHERALEELARLRIDRADADAAGRDLRVRLAGAVAAARAASAAGGEAAGDPIGVLADVLGRADERAGVLAGYADEARTAGLACERSYDALVRR
jgi:hypothetical protein